MKERAPARSGNDMAVPSPLSGPVTNSVLLERSLTCSAVFTDGQSNQGSNAYEGDFPQLLDGDEFEEGTRDLRRDCSWSGCPGRPLSSEVVSKDVIIVELGIEKIPTKCEKPELERSGRVIPGFDINRKWDVKQLHRELSTLLKLMEYCLKS